MNLPYKCTMENCFTYLFIGSSKIWKILPFELDHKYCIFTVKLLFFYAYYNRQLYKFSMNWCKCRKVQDLMICVYQISLKRKFSILKPKLETEMLKTYHIRCEMIGLKEFGRFYPVLKDSKLKGSFEVNNRNKNPRQLLS